ncbi:fatty acid--CoA ligase [soil metagenome]
MPGVEHDRMRTLGDVLRYHAGRSPAAVALSFEGIDTTFATLDQRADAVAAGLIDLGIGPGDRVGYLAKNSDAFFEIFLGCVRIGAVVTPVGWRLGDDEIVYILQDAGVRVLFAGRESAPQVSRLAARLETVATIFALEPVAQDWPLYPVWRDHKRAVPGVQAVSPSDVAIQLYTSGTTGRPKGAMLSHENILLPRQLNADAGLAWEQWTVDDVALAAMPVSHLGGSLWPIYAFYWGARVSVVREFSPAQLLDHIRDDGVSILFIVPSALQIVLRDPRVATTDFSRVRHMLYGASPIPLDLLREAINVIGCGFVQVYGLTETTGAIVGLGPDDHDLASPAKLASTGRPFPQVEISIRSPVGEVLETGEVGEIYVRSPSNMVGYWNLPEATLDAVPAGWLKTGDAGRLDEDGYLYICDRIKDMIITGGENVYAPEVENVLYSHPDVLDAAAIAVPDARWGEAVKAVIVLRPGARVDEDGIRQWCRDRIASFKSPKTVDFVDALPRNGTGKVMKHQLREPFWADVGRRVN